MKIILIHIEEAALYGDKIIRLKDSKIEGGN